MIRITDTLALDERDFEEHFVRGSGPGGQNVNKVATAVELRFNVTGSSLPEEVKQRLMVLAGHRMTSSGELLIDSREHRTQAQNRDQPRAGSREKRLASKKHRGAVKQLRGRGDASDD